MPRYTSLVLAFLLLASLTPLAAEDVHVAVAANFTAPARTLASAFESESGHRVQLSLGSSGKFFAQIKNGAPFDVLLSADQEIPERLAREGLAVRDTHFTYAVGRLVLWSATPGLVDEKGAILKSNRFQHLAIPNPRLAPYGRAAEEVLKRQGMLDSLRSRLVQAENITQAHAFVAGGNAELGFVALSQVIGSGGKITDGSAWMIPTDLYSPIKQDCVLLNRARDNPAALAFLRYLKGERARAVMRSHGYSH